MVRQLTGTVNGISVPVSTSANGASAPTKTRLSTGLSIWRGLVSEEYLNSLKPWSRAVKIFQEMQDDVVIGALFESIKTPLLASPFEVTAAGPSDEDKRAKEFLENNLFKGPVEWQQHIEDAMEFLDMGFAITEPVLEKNKQDSMMHLRTLMPVGQESLHEWGPINDIGFVTSFTQRDPITGKINAAPMDKLLHFTFRGRKRNPQGRGIMRSLYRPWYFKKNLEAIEAIGAERDVGNAPVAELKEGVSYSSTDITDLEAALEGFRMDEAVYVILPGGVKLNAYGGGNKVYNIREMIRDWQHLIRQRFFADFLSLGSEQVGTQALAREMATFFGLALRSIQEMMLAVWNRQLVPWLFKWNNWNLESLPQVAWLKPGEANLQSLAQAYSTLTNSGLLDPDEAELQARIRTQIGLSPMELPELERRIAERRSERLTIGANTNGVNANANQPQVEASERRMTSVVSSWDEKQISKNKPSTAHFGILQQLQDLLPDGLMEQLAVGRGLEQAKNALIRLFMDRKISSALLDTATRKVEEIAGSSEALLNRDIMDKRSLIRDPDEKIITSTPRDDWFLSEFGIGDSLSDIVTRLLDMVSGNTITRSEAFQGLQELQQRRMARGLLTGFDAKLIQVQTERLVRALWPKEEADLLLGIA